MKYSGLENLSIASVILTERNTFKIEIQRSLITEQTVGNYQLTVTLDHKTNPLVV